MEKEQQKEKENKELAEEFEFEIDQIKGKRCLKKVGRLRGKQHDLVAVPPV